MSDMLLAVPDQCFFTCNSSSNMNVICFSVELTSMPDTILSTLTCKLTSVASEDHSDDKTKGGGKDKKQDTAKSQERNQENSCSIEEMCEDKEETDDSSSEDNPYPRPQDCGLSPLTSSPCPEEDGEASDSGEDL